MISKSILLRGENKPFLLKPAAKDYLWGGSRLNNDYSKNINISPLAETWECSTHPDGVSVVASGKYSGRPLSDVIAEHKEYLGKHSECIGDLPVLVKLIDAKEDLSIQVHPNDSYAEIHEYGKKGKTELWYILDSANDSTVVYGFHHSVDRETVRRSILDGRLEYYIQKVPAKKDDVFFISPGTVHAIGKGLLIAEIQENSNITYRLYDYNRIDKNGKKRDLHIDKALDVACLDADKEPSQPMRVLKYSPGCAVELLGRCKHFSVERLIINTERIRSMASISADDLSFKILLCINGCGSVICYDETINVFKGDCVFVPANSPDIKIHGKAQFLSISC